MTVALKITFNGKTDDAYFLRLSCYGISATLLHDMACDLAGSVAHGRHCALGRAVSFPSVVDKRQRKERPAMQKD